MRRLFKEKIVFKLFFILFISICIPIIIFSSISYYMSYRSIYDSYIESKNNLNKQVAENISDNFFALKSQSIALYNYDNIAYLLNADKENLTEDYIENYNIVYENLVSIIQGNFKLDSISIIDLDGEVKFYYDRNMAIQNLNNVDGEEWFHKTVDANGVAIIVPPHKNIYTNSQEEVISVCRIIADPYNDQTVGILKIDQKMKTFEKIFSNIDLEDGEINIVYDQEGNAFYSNIIQDTNEIENIFASLNSSLNKATYTLNNNDEKMISCGESMDQKWKIVSMVDVENISQKADFLKHINTILTIILFFVCAGLSVLVSFTINNPIRKLIESIKRFQNGNMYEQVDIKRKDEFGSIADAFNEMISSIRKLIDEEYKMELLKKQAEFENYQSQINPHFLFNTLNTIKAVAIQGENEKTVDMIQYLSDNFRYSLNRGISIVPFCEELAYVDKYIYLQKIRFTDKYQIDKEIDEEVLDNEIPRMILQPIVENAFIHGLENSAETAAIQIVAQNIEDEFYIYISNTGKIIEEDKLKEINARLSVGEEKYKLENKDKVGIFNVNARIRYTYGEPYGLKFINSGNNLTTVKIRLPKIKAKAEEQINENIDY